jgi:hypothetical protein
MPDLSKDKNQLRFAHIRSQMLTGLVEHLPDGFMEQSGAKTRAELMIKLCESDSVMAIVETCAYVAQGLEDSRVGRRGCL